MSYLDYGLLWLACGLVTELVLRVKHRKTAEAIYRGCIGIYNQLHKVEGRSP